MDGSSFDFNVAVVGAGLSGLQCAKLLARKGFSVLLLDRKNSPSASIQTTGIFVRRTLEDFKLPDNCLGPPVRHVSLYSPRRHALHLVSPRAEFQVGRMERVYQHFLAECLREGVVWRPRAAYESSKPFQGGSQIQFQSDNKTHKARVRYIVGADGTLSTVARDLALDINKDWLVGVEDVYRTRSGKGPPRFHCFLDPMIAPGYVAWVVDDANMIHVGVAGYPKRFDPAKALGDFTATLSGFVSLQDQTLMERRGGRISVGGVLQEIASTRGLLVGDAAGAPSPLTAGGLDACLRLSAHAAGTIGEFLRCGDKKVLARYDGREFRARFVSRLWMRRILASIRDPGLLEQACWLLRRPLFRALAWNVFFGPGSFPDLETAAVPV